MAFDGRLKSQEYSEGAKGVLEQVRSKKQTTAAPMAVVEHGLSAAFAGSRAVGKAVHVDVKTRPMVHGSEYIVVALADLVGSADMTCSDVDLDDVASGFADSHTSLASIAGDIEASWDPSAGDSKAVGRLGVVSYGQVWAHRSHHGVAGEEAAWAFAAHTSCSDSSWKTDLGRRLPSPRRQHFRQA